MAKRIPWARLAVLILWQILDFLIHVVILGSSYAATRQFWRPEDEMKHGLMLVVGLVSATAIVLIYARLIDNKSVVAAVKYGVLLGLAFGFSMGFGMYSVMPIPYYMALTWFLGTLVEMTLTGLVLGLIIKD